MLLGFGRKRLHCCQQQQVPVPLSVSLLLTAAQSECRRVESAAAESHRLSESELINTRHSLLLLVQFKIGSAAGAF